MRSTRVETVALTLVTLIVAAGITVAQTAPKAPPSNSQSHLFQVVLLLADVSGDSTLDELSPNARKALDDIQDFLPFSSYRMLDVALVRSNGSANTKLNGPDELKIEIEFDFRPVGSDSGRIDVGIFRMNDVTEHLLKPGVAPGVRRLMDTRFEVEIGETIVVGSSKLESPGQALIVLFTAIP